MNLDDHLSDQELDSHESGVPEPNAGLFGLGKSTLILLTIFASVFMLAAASYIWDISRTAWPTTTGRITEVTEPPGARGVAPGLFVNYNYKIGDQSYDERSYFAPGPGQPAKTTFNTGEQTSVYYNPLLPWMSTIAPDSQGRLYMMYMVFAAIAAAITLIARPDLNAGREIRSQLPEFLDCLATLIEAGVSVPAAIEQAGNACAGSCPDLSIQVSKCVLSFKNSRIPLHQSLSQLGTAYRVEELNSLASSLAAAEMSGSSVAYQIKQQSGSLKYRLKSEQLAQENASTNLGVRRYDSGPRPWIKSSKAGPMTAQEILDALEPKDKQK